MASVENVIARQYDLYGLIARAIENLNKLGPPRITRGAVQSRMGALKTNWEKFQTYLENLCKARSAETETLPYFADDLYSLCEKYLDAHGTMIDMLDTLELNKAQSAPSNEASLTSSSGSHSRRLPRIELPTLSGDYAQWSPFRDLFTSMIMDNNNLSAVEKLHYLKMSLTGEPAQLLKNVAISNENLKRAWDTLVTRYENKRIMIDAQLSVLFATRKVKIESASELKRLLGAVKEALEALEALGCPVLHWDHLIVFMTVRNLDFASLKDWENTLGLKTAAPTFADLEAFLIGHIHTLEAIERSAVSRKQPVIGAPPAQFQTRPRAHAATTAEQQCASCASGHYIVSCPKYLAKTPSQRREYVTSKGLCYNCLGPHHVRACRNAKRCRVCRKPHHSSLHLSSGDSDAATTASASELPSNANAGTSAASVSSSSRHGGSVSMPQVLSHAVRSLPIRRTPMLLATAHVTVVSRFGEQYQLRALLDQGFEASFISEYSAQLLKLPRKAVAVPILGIGAQRSSVSNGCVSLEIISRINSPFSLVVDALVLPKLTAHLPSAQVACTQWPHIDGLPLADPNFSTPGKIDLVLGARVYAQILEDGICRGSTDSPMAQKTALGWILSGTLSTDQDHPSTETAIIGMQCALDWKLLEILQRFWNQEEITPSSDVSLTPEDAQCEEHFKTTYSRDAQGRFVVRLPLRKPVEDFGDSRTPALKMLLRMEKRFETHASLKTAYTEFLRVYRELDHMRPSNSLESSRREFFLPHHGVVKETSSSTKLRLVFNGSQKTNLGLSVNECLHVGPKLEIDLTDILTRWRRHRYVFAADIEKMYRQIRVHSDDWPLQKILWRDSPSERPQEYQLCTVTYGLACAPYLALRCLQQLAIDSQTTRVHAAEILRRDTYVDDILSGADSVSNAKEKILQLNGVLTAGGFTLRKWIANSPYLLADISPRDHAMSSMLPIGDTATHCTLSIGINSTTPSCFPHLRFPALVT